MLKGEPNWSLPVKSLADVQSTNSAAPFGDLPCGPAGEIVVTGHSANGSAIARVSGSDVAVDRGQQVGAYGSIVFVVKNASKLSHIAETGSPVLMVTAR